MKTMNISVRNGAAVLPDGTAVNLLGIQSALNCAFGETGHGEYALAANQMALITGMIQGPHEEWLPVEGLEGLKMKNPMDDEQYDSNDEQIADLKSALASALQMINNLEGHLEFTGWGDHWERTVAEPLMKRLEEFNKETEDWK